MSGNVWLLAMLSAPKWVSQIPSFRNLPKLWSRDFRKHDIISLPLFLELLGFLNVCCLDLIV